jgi:hypothetical protein
MAGVDIRTVGELPGHNHYRRDGHFAHSES